MLKALAAVLLVAQVATLNAPVLSARPAEPDAPPCVQVATHVGGATGVLVEADCQGCELPDCHALHGCAGATPALANDVTVQLEVSFALSDDAELLSRHVVGDSTPTSPPPRA